MLLFTTQWLTVLTVQRFPVIFDPNKLLVANMSENWPANFAKAKS